MLIKYGSFPHLNKHTFKIAGYKWIPEWDTTSQPIRTVIIKKKKKRKKEQVLVRMWRNWNPWAFLLGMWNGVAAFGKHYGNSSERNNYCMIQKQVSSGYIFQGNWKWGLKQTFLHPCSQQHWSQLANRWKRSKCPSREGWISQVCNVHRIECHSAFKSMEILTNAITWMNLEDTMQSEISQW